MLPLPPPPSASDQGTGTQTVPDVIGLPEDLARRVLADAGFAGTVTTTQVQTAGPTGVVATQEPVFGQPLGDTVSIALSAPATMPDLVGVDIDEARTRLEELGAVVLVDRLVAPTAATGTVVSTTPGAGDAVAAEVTLAVSDLGEALALGTVPTVEGSGCREVGKGSVDGVLVEASVLCRPRLEDPATVTWNLSRLVSGLTATVGVSDTSTSGPARVRILGDGVPLVEVDVALGTSAPVLVPLAGVLRLTIEVTTTASSADVLLGDANLVGERADLDALAAL